MKNVTKPANPLVLTTHTVRVLTAEELRQIAGAGKVVNPWGLDVGTLPPNGG